MISASAIPGYRALHRAIFTIPDYFSNKIACVILVTVTPVANTDLCLRLVRNTLLADGNSWLHSGSIYRFIFRINR